MYRILCFSAGEYVKLSKSLAYEQLRLPGLPPEMREGMRPIINLAYRSENWGYAEFTTEEAAKWFVSHRLVYNPRRNNSRKINLMKNTFEYNNIPGWQTVKLEFEIHSV